MSAEEEVQQENVPKQRFVNAIVSAAGDRYIAPLLTESGVVGFSCRLALPLFKSFQPAAQAVVNQIDTAVDGVLCKGSGIWDRSHSALSQVVDWHATTGGIPVVNKVGIAATTKVYYSKLRSDLRKRMKCTLINTMNVTSFWIDERIELLLLSSEALVDTILPPPPTDTGGDYRSGANSSNVNDESNSSGQLQTRRQRILAVPFEVRGRLAYYANRLQSNAMELVQGAETSRFPVVAFLRKIVNPVAVREHQETRWVNVAFVIVHSRLENIKLNFLQIVDRAMMDYSSLLPLANVRSKTLDLCRQYYNAWRLPSKEEIVNSVRAFQRMMIDVHEKLPQHQKEFLRKAYMFVFSTGRRVLGDVASDQLLHVITQSVIMQWLNESLSFYRDSSTTATSTTSLDSQSLEALSTAAPSTRHSTVAGSAGSTPPILSPEASSPEQSEALKVGPQQKSASVDPSASQDPLISLGPTPPVAGPAAPLVVSTPSAPPVAVRSKHKRKASSSEEHSRRQHRRNSSLDIIE